MLRVVYYNPPTLSWFAIKISDYDPSFSPAAAQKKKKAEQVVGKG